MKHELCIAHEKGFSLLELLIAVLILIPIMGAAVSLLSSGTSQYTSEQNSIDVNQEARAAFEMMTTEIAQAGSHSDRDTVTTTAVTGNTAAPQTVSVGSTEGITKDDWIDVDLGDEWESVKPTAVTSTTITGIFRYNHDATARIHLFALPYKNGIVPPAGMAPNSSMEVTTLKFFGETSGNSVLQYVEYAYDAGNNQITRSVTPITQTGKNPAIPFVSNIKPGSFRFTVNSDKLGIITSVNISMTVQSTVKTGTKYQETELSSRVVIPSAAAASKLSYEAMRYGGLDRLPVMPSRVVEWKDQ